MLIPLESGGLKGAELDKATELAGCGGGSGGGWLKQIRREVEKGGEGECICSQPLGRSARKSVVLRVGSNEGSRYLNCMRRMSSSDYGFLPPQGRARGSTLSRR
ncbi:hypothetical protein EYF80_055345 [Liparis tanakae]|uniref:Uncharacterized protein n=1 Tax=Liparis tanakae TaxID=230148 RepID=A0A4Z2F035_9TELE|nr:hypothetical protein EYF80_055345 [Liparis tanakae]